MTVLSDEQQLAVLVSRADQQRHDHRNQRMVVDDLEARVDVLEGQLVALRVRLYTLAAALVAFVGLAGWAIELAMR